MNFKSLSIGLGLVAASAVALPTIPAQAASFLGTPVIPASPIKGASTKAAFPFSASTFVGDGKTYKFELVATKGKNLASFGFSSGGGFTSLLTEKKAYDPGSNEQNDWLGTCGVSLTPCTTSFKFEKGTTYQLGLEDQKTKEVTSWGLSQLGEYTYSVKSDQLKPVYTTVKAPNTYFLGFEDGTFAKDKSKGLFYYDYQDFIVKATVPEPTTIAGLGLVAGALAFSRRRKSNKAV